MKTKKIPKHVYLPVELVELGETKARRLGYSITRYMEYLLAKDVEAEAERIEILDKKTIADVGKGVTDMKKEDFVGLLKTENDIEQFVEGAANG